MDAKTIPVYEHVLIDSQCICHPFFPTFDVSCNRSLVVTGANVPNRHLSSNEYPVTAPDIPRL